MSGLTVYVMYVYDGEIEDAGSFGNYRINSVRSVEVENVVVVVWDHASKVYGYIVISKATKLNCVQCKDLYANFYAGKSTFSPIQGQYEGDLRLFRNQQQKHDIDVVFYFYFSMQFTQRSIDFFQRRFSLFKPSQK